MSDLGSAIGHWIAIRVVIGAVIVLGTGVGIGLLIAWWAA
jgi:hypothetical protein